MERGESSGAAQAGLTTVYGLGNDCDLIGGVAWRGHDGAAQGFLSSVRYSQELGVGFVVLLNSTSEPAMRELQLLFATFARAGAPIHAAAPVASTAAELEFAAGYYDKINPRFQTVAFLESLMGIRRLAVENGHLVRKPIVGESESLVALGHGLFRFANEPAATHAVFEDRDGRHALASGSYYGVQTPGWICWTRLLGAAAVFTVLIVFLALGIVLAPFEVWKRGVRRLAAPSLTWLAAVGLLAFLVLLVGIDTEQFGRETVLTVTIYLLSFAAPMLAAAAVLAGLLLSRRYQALPKVNLIAALAAASANAYLLAFGVFGVKLF
jgi:hypothetical protein